MKSKFKIIIGSYLDRDDFYADIYLADRDGQEIPFASVQADDEGDLHVKIISETRVNMEEFKRMLDETQERLKGFND